MKWIINLSPFGVLFCLVPFFVFAPLFGKEGGRGDFRKGFSGEFQSNIKSPLPPLRKGEKNEMDN